MTAAASRGGTDPTRVDWDGGELVVSRVFGAPREVVFQAWTRPEHFARWWGPHGATLSIRAMDARPGGALHYCHSFPDHEDVWIGGLYGDVRAPEHIMFTCWFSTPDGGRAERPGFPAEMTISIDFGEHPRGTLVTARHAGLDQDQGEVQGWKEGLDRLATLLATLDTPNPEQ
jgi:uncharacterized protein YndB with AHSA1/START domain